jgi:hypothetical protein
LPVEGELDPTLDLVLLGLQGKKRYSFTSHGVDAGNPSSQLGLPGSGLGSNKYQVIWQKTPGRFVEVSHPVAQDPAGLCDSFGSFHFRPIGRTLAPSPEALEVDFLNIGIALTKRAQCQSDVASIPQIDGLLDTRTHRASHAPFPEHPHQTVISDVDTCIHRRIDRPQTGGANLLFVLRDEGVRFQLFDLRRSPKRGLKGS